MLKLVESLIIIMLAGGFDFEEEEDSLDTILEYDINGDSYTQKIGTMIQARRFHAISVVKYKDFSEWCM